MPNMRRTTATIGAAALVATPLTLLTAAPASAAEKEFGIGGADIHFEVEKDDGRFEVELDIDDARPGSRWRVTLWHDGQRFHRKVHRADDDGEVEIDKDRRNTRGKDVFKVRVKKVGGVAKSRTIRMR
jgi:hypothetical protein